MQNINLIKEILTDIYDSECSFCEGSLTRDLYFKLIQLLDELKEYIK